MENTPSNSTTDSKVPQALIDNVYVKTSLSVSGEDREQVRGYDFNNGIDYE